MVQNHKRYVTLQPIMTRKSADKRQRLTALLLLMLYLPMVIATITHTHNGWVSTFDHQSEAIITANEPDSCPICQLCSQTYIFTAFLTLTTIILLRPIVRQEHTDAIVSSQHLSPSLRAPPMSA